MGVKVTVKFGPRPTRLIAALEGKTVAASKSVAAMMRIFVAFLRARFAKFSQGGGNWARLKPATIARRRNHSSSILRNTGLMFAQFSPELVTLQGLNGKNPFSAVIAFGGKAHYPDGVSVTEVMSFHQEGAGHLPVRKLIVPPDAVTKTAMGLAVKKILKADAGF